MVSTHVCARWGGGGRGGVLNGQPAVCHTKAKHVVTGQQVVQRAAIFSEAALGEFSSRGSTFCADSYFGIRSTPVLPQ